MIPYKKKNDIRFYALPPIICIVCFYLLISGCAFTKTLPMGTGEDRAEDRDPAALKKGDDAFREGNYQKALEIYGILSRLSLHQTTKRKAMYGLACTKLILAENQAELNEAMILWDAWSRTAPRKISDEDPRMLRPVLTKKSMPGIMPRKQIAVTENPEHDEMPLHIIQSKTDEIKNLKNIIASQQKEIETLKHQINSLEAIDQDMLQKKKDISIQ